MEKEKKRISPAQIKAVTKYEAANYDKILLRLKAENNPNRAPEEPTREEIRSAADEAGQSINEYILEAIKEKMQK